MSSEQEAPIWNPKFRKRKKHEGATWTPGSASAVSGDGVYCRHCHKRHGYMTLGIDYEKASDGSWRILWMCKTTGAVISEMKLGGSRDDRRGD